MESGEVDSEKVRSCLNEKCIFLWADVVDAVLSDVDDTATARTLGHSLA